MSSELSQLLELLGEDATLKIVEAYGGTRLIVPKVKPETHALIDLMGEDGFALLWQYFGGDELRVPMARGWRFDVYSRRGLKPKEIVRLAKCSEDAYYKWAQRRADSRQTAFSF